MAGYEHHQLDETEAALPFIFHLDGLVAEPRVNESFNDQFVWIVFITERGEENALGAENLRGGKADAAAFREHLMHMVDQGLEFGRCEFLGGDLFGWRAEDWLTELRHQFAVDRLSSLRHGRSPRELRRGGRLRRSTTAAKR